MDKKESLLKQRDKAKKEAAQYENQVKILLNKQRDAERHARNHRLIVHGAIMEGEAIKAFLIALSRLPGAVASCGRDGELHSPNPLCASKNETSALRLFRFRWPVIPPLLTAEEGGKTHSDFYCPIQIIKRSVGRSAVAAAACRSGEKLTNEWDGKTHDYTHKPGVVRTEIMLPAHAPPEFQDRSTLWNSVEEIEKSSDAQLAREIEVALPVELSRAEQLALVRSFVKDNSVAEGMCADFALHDKGDGNPHAHIMLTIRPLKPDGHWGPKCRKVYDLDSQGNRIPDGKGGWKNHRADIFAGMSISQFNTLGDSACSVTSAIKEFFEKVHEIRHEMEKEHEN